MQQGAVWWVCDAVVCIDIKLNIHLSGLASDVRLGWCALPWCGSHKGCLPLGQRSRCREHQAGDALVAWA